MNDELRSLLAFAYLLEMFEAIREQSRQRYIKALAQAYEKVAKTQS